MKNNYSVWRSVAGFFGLFMLTCAISAHATAPRVTAQMFGEEKKSDIVSYPLSSTGTVNTAVEIVAEAFKAAAKNPLLDVLPSKQLSTYALLNGDTPILMGRPQDLADKDKKQYTVVTFFMADEQPVCLIFNKGTAYELHKAFIEGLKVIIKNGKYQEILDLHHIQLPVDFMNHLKHPGRK